MHALPKAIEMFSVSKFENQPNSARVQYDWTDILNFLLMIQVQFYPFLYMHCLRVASAELGMNQELGKLDLKYLLDETKLKNSNLEDTKRKTFQLSIIYKTDTETHKYILHHPFFILMLKMKNYNPLATWDIIWNQNDFYKSATSGASCSKGGYPPDKSLSSG